MKVLLRSIALTWISMTDNANRERNAAVVELNEAIRQLDRYLTSPNPVTRIIKQKIEKGEQKADTFKGSHFNYCRVAKVELNDATQVEFFQETLDKAEDASDRAMVVLDQREEDESATVQATQSANDATLQETIRTLKITQLKSLLASDKSFATDVANKVSQIVDADVTNEGLASQVDSYTQRLFELDEKINTSWQELVSL